MIKMNSSSSALEHVKMHKKKKKGQCAHLK
jgi:hypothetical protein